jgi:hypothetical protein
MSFIGEDSIFAYYVQRVIFTIVPSLFLTIPAYYFLKKRAMFTWYDVVLFIYGYSIWFFIMLLMYSTKYYKVKTLSNFVVEPTIISFSVLILTYLRLFVPVEVLTVKVRFVIITIIALLVHFLMPSLRE